MIGIYNSSEEDLYYWYFYGKHDAGTQWMDNETYKGKLLGFRPIVCLKNTVELQEEEGTFVIK